jgi:hypothetical protein
MVWDVSVGALLDFATCHRDVIMVEADSNHGMINEKIQNEINGYAANDKPTPTINTINAMMESRVDLGDNAARLLTV